MSTEIRIPKSKKDLRIKHYKAIKESVFSKRPTVSEQVVFLSDLTGASLHEIKKLPKKDVDILYRTSLLSFAGFKLNDSPPKEITLDGKIFELINPNKVAAGWHIDFDNTDLVNDPVRKACLYYFPKGERYGETDDNGNLINPIADRKDILREHLPLQAFLEADAFFLTKLHRSMQLQAISERAARKGAKLRDRVRSLFGRKPSMH